MYNVNIEISEDEKNILLDALSYLRSIENRQRVMGRYGYEVETFDKVDDLEQKIMDAE